MPGEEGDDLMPEQLRYSDFGLVAGGVCCKLRPVLHDEVVKVTQPSFTTQGSHYASDVHRIKEQAEEVHLRSTASTIANEPKALEVDQIHCKKTYFMVSGERAMRVAAGYSAAAVRMSPAARA